MPDIVAARPVMMAVIKMVKATPVLSHADSPAPVSSSVPNGWELWRSSDAVTIHISSSMAEIPELRVMAFIRIVQSYGFFLKISYFCALC